MQEKIAKPELSRAIELAGQLIEQAQSLLISKTKNPDELLANSYQEHQALRKYESLLEKATNPDCNIEAEAIWDELFDIIIDVIVKVRDMINSISCLLTEGIHMNPLRYSLPLLKI